MIMRRFTQSGDVERTRELVAKVCYQLSPFTHCILSTSSLVKTDPVSWPIFNIGSVQMSDGLVFRMRTFTQNSRICTSVLYAKLVFLG